MKIGRLLYEIILVKLLHHLPSNVLLNFISRHPVIFSVRYKTVPYSRCQEFCIKFQIKHNTGIPYYPQGQAIVDRGHQTLKIQIQKLKEGEFKYSYPHQILQHALFVINNLNADSSEQQDTKPLVKWKDFLSGQWKGPDPLLTSG